MSLKSFRGDSVSLTVRSQRYYGRILVKFENFLQWCENNPPGFGQKVPPLVIQRGVSSDPMKFVLGYEADDGGPLTFSTGWINDENDGVFHYSFKAVGRDGTELFKTRHGKHEFFEDADPLEWEFPTLEELKQLFEELMPDEYLELSLDIVVADLIETVTTLDSEDLADPESSTLGQSLKTLWKDNELTDFKLVCAGETFPCHKVVLACRSDVFKAMFSHGHNQEVLTGQAIIKDCKPDILNKFLEFLYTDYLVDVALVSSSDLLILADKYNVVSLKSKCEKTLCKNIDCSNALQLLNLSTCISVPKLLETAAKFVSCNRCKLFGSTQWNKLIKNNPQVLEAIIQFGI